MTEPADPAAMERFVFVDIETTGLDVNKDKILEVGIEITDIELNSVAFFKTLIWSRAHAYAFEDAVPFVKDLHMKNNLNQDCLEHGRSPYEAEKMVRQFLQENGIGKDDPMCGSSVPFDRKFLQAHMPSVESTFSYRDVNVSTVKELCRRFNPVLYSKLEDDIKPNKNPETFHRVNSCLTDTINEFRWYRDNFLWI